MPILKHKFFGLLAVISLLILPLVARAEVHDNAHIFSPETVDRANAAMADMQRNHGKTLDVELFAAIPDDLKAQYHSDDKQEFFRNWMARRANALQTNGVYVLICMDPKYIEVGAGKYTIQHGDFTPDDVNELRSQLQSAFHEQQYDQGLLQAVDMVERTYSARIHGGENRGSSTGYAPAPVNPNSPIGGFGFGSFLCLCIGAVVLFSLIGSIFRGHSGYGSYGGGYYPPQGPGYGGYGYGPRGSGFGSGLLGGLLGGILGGYAADRFDHRNEQSGGGSIFGGGGGSSFDSGPSDVGQGFGDNSSGGGFGGGGGGGGDSSGGGF